MTLVEKICSIDMKKNENVLKEDLIDIKMVDDKKFSPKYDGRTSMPEVTLNEDMTWSAEYRGETINGALSERLIEDLCNLGVILPKDDKNHKDSLVLYIRRAVVEWVSKGYSKGKTQIDKEL